MPLTLSALSCAGEETRDDSGREEAAALCSPGDTRRCIGPGACGGGQACEDDGTWGDCLCAAPPARDGSTTAKRDSAVIPDGAPERPDGSDADVSRAPDADARPASDGGDGGGADDAALDDGGSSTIDDCTERLQASELAQLRSGGAAGTMGWLDPYDRTVFARGLRAPTLQWEGPSPSAVYVRLESARFTYETCRTALQAPLRLSLDQGAWNLAAHRSVGNEDPLTVTLSTLSQGSVTTIVAEWRLAAGPMAGAVYYSSYSSPLANLNGAVLKLTPGDPFPVASVSESNGLPPLGPCVGCHSVSMDGTRALVNRHSYPLGPYESLSFDVRSAPPTQLRSDLDETGFAGMFPDGSRAMTNGPPNSSSATSSLFPYGSNNVAGLIGPGVSRLIDVALGTPIAAPGWDTEVMHAQMPMFSPDGRHLVYNDHDRGGGHTLWVIDFDPATNSFSNRRELYTDETRYPGWPSFTPDSRAVVFGLGTRNDFVSQAPDRLTLVPDQVGRSSLFIAYLESPGQAVMLTEAGNATDYEFYPMVSPRAGADYYWVLFTSRRRYGNRVNVLPNDPESKKVWVAAIDANGDGSSDPSHPAFFLDGQELVTGNWRPVPVLAP